MVIYLALVVTAM